MKKVLLLTCIFFGAVASMKAQQTSPIWPGCENAEDISACFSQKLGEHVKENYEYPMNGNNEYVRGKVTISFAVTEQGEVEVQSVEGEEPLVNEAAREMFAKIPKMQPGTLNGEPATRSFTVAYNF